MSKIDINFSHLQDYSTTIRSSDTLNVGTYSGTGINIYTTDLISDTSIYAVYDNDFSSRRYIDEVEYNRLKNIEKKYIEAFGNNETKEVDILTDDRNITIK
jgi:hypothetical protein